MKTIITDRCECADLIKFLAKSTDVSIKCKHIKFLVVASGTPGSGLANTLSCDLSDFLWYNLLQKKDLDVETVQAIVSLGGIITYNDIFCVMKHVQDPAVISFTVENTAPGLSDREVIRLYRQSKSLNNFAFAEELLLSRDHNALMKRAMKANWLDIIEMLILKGTEVDLNALLIKMFKKGWSDRPDLISFIKSKPEGCIQLFYKAVEHLQLNLANECLLHNEGENIRNVDLSMVINLLTKQINLRKRDLISFIEELLRNKVIPNQNGSEVPLSTVLKLSDEFHNEKVELLKLLLQYHADVKNCINVEVVGKTPIHFATKLAIDSGKD